MTLISPLRGSQKVFDRAKVAAHVCRQFPSTVIAPLLVFAVLCTLGVWAVWHVSDQDVTYQKDSVRAEVLDFVKDMEDMIMDVTLPVRHMAIAATRTPQWSRLSNDWAWLVERLVQSVPVLTAMQLAPFATIRAVLPPTPANEHVLGYDLYNLPDEGESQALMEQIKGKHWEVYGPVALVQGGIGLVIKEPVYVANVSANETFGLPAASSKCQQWCYNAETQTIFWGFTIGIVDWLELLSSPRIHYGFMSRGYLVHLVLRLPGREDLTLTATKKRPRDPVKLELGHNIPGMHIVDVEVSPSDGWKVAWLAPLTVVVVVCSFLIAAMLFLVLLAKRRQEILLQALVPRQIVDKLATDTNFFSHTASNGVSFNNIIGSGTPADLILDMMASLLTGRTPSPEDVLSVRSAILQARDIYTPMDVQERIARSQLDADVIGGLAHILGAPLSPAHTPLPLQGYAGDEQLVASLQAGLGGDLGSFVHAADRFTTMREALQFIMLHEASSSVFSQTSQAAPSTAPGAECTITALPGILNKPARVPNSTGSTGIAVPTSNTSITGSSAAKLHVNSSNRPMAPTQHTLLGQVLCALPPMPSSAPGQERTSSSRHGVTAETDTGVCTVDGGPKAFALMSAANGCTKADGRSLTLMHRDEEPGSLDSHIGAKGWGGSREVAGAASAIANMSSADLLPSSSHGVRSAVSTSKDITSDLEALRSAPSHCTRFLCEPSMFGGSLHHAQLLRESRLQLVAPGPHSATSLRVASPALDSSAHSGRQYMISNNTSMVCSVQPLATATSLTLQNPSPNSSGRRTAVNGQAWVQPARRESVSQPPPLVLMEKVEELLAAAETSWTFNSFALAEATNNHPLSTLGFYLINRSGLLDSFCLDPVKLARFLTAVEGGYRDNPYHNKTHASDVLQTLHVLLTRGGLVPHYADPLTHLACLLAACVHDLEHLGLTNDFLVQTSDDLAIIYNDRSPMENHHLAAAFSLLRKPGYAFHGALQKDEQNKLRKTIIDLVLGTDMKQHFAIVSHFSTLHRLNAAATTHLPPGRVPSKASLGNTQTIANGRVHLSPHSSAHQIAPGGAINGVGGGVGGQVQPRTLGRTTTQTLQPNSSPEVPVNITAPARMSASGVPTEVHNWEAVKKMPSGGLPIVQAQPHTHAKPGSGPAQGHNAGHVRTSLAAIGPRVAGLSAGLHTESSSVAFTQASSLLLTPIDETDRMLSLQLALKCSDLGHMAEDLETHLRWVSCLEEEFYRQGDAEKAAGLPVSPLFDRDKPGVTKSQVGFMEVIALPISHNFTAVFTLAKPFHDAVTENYKYWRRISGDGRH